MDLFDMLKTIFLDAFGIKAAPSGVNINGGVNFTNARPANKYFVNDSSPVSNELTNTDGSAYLKNTVWE